MNPPIFVAALYHFVRLDNPDSYRQPLLDCMQANNIRGTLLLAGEGINGTISGTREAIDSLLNWLRADPHFAELSHKESVHAAHPFHRSKVKLKGEIVTMGVEGIDPNHIKGSYVDPADWDALINDPEVTLIDTRNDYEVQIGSFKGAINPGTETFREFPDYVEQSLDPRVHKKVAMFCTGGIRCEKSTAYLKEQGFEEVYHLKGGILKYLEEVPEEQSSWEGECFVFDNRVAVNHQLEKGQYEQCFACRYPITIEDQRSDDYVPGVSCPHCIDRQVDRDRFAERERQMQLAKARGETHIGSDASAAAERHRLEKQRKRERQRKG